MKLIEIWAMIIYCEQFDIKVKIERIETNWYVKLILPDRSRTFLFTDMATAFDNVKWAIKGDTDGH